MNVIGVKIKDEKGVYYFVPGNLNLKIGDDVVVENNVGIGLGTVVTDLKNLKSKDKTVKKIVRKATNEDYIAWDNNEGNKKRALEICTEKIRDRKLNMKLIRVEYSLDKSKIMFYFSADGRVDFRGLVKDLASAFHTRIELRQVGVRDEAQFFGGLGICGNPFCCATFLKDFEPVSIKMAKEQGLSLNPVKISGTCGRLMCCLKYEQNAYSDLLKKSPKIGAVVSTPDGTGTVMAQNLLLKRLTVKLDKTPETVPVVYSSDDVVVLKDGKMNLDKKEEELLEKLK